MAIWFFIFERLNMCTALICACPERASEEERGFFCTVPRCEIYLARFMSLCEHLCSTNTKVEEKR